MMSALNAKIVVALDFIYTNKTMKTDEYITLNSKILRKHTHKAKNIYSDRKLGKTGKLFIVN